MFFDEWMKNATHVDCFEEGDSITQQDLIALGNDLENVLYNYAFLATIHQGLAEEEGKNFKEQVVKLLDSMKEELSNGVDKYWEEKGIPDNVIQFKRKA